MPIARILATLVATATAATLVSAAPAVAAPTFDPGPRHDGAAWLTGELTDGVIHNEQYGFDDFGLSIDVALGLDAAGQKPKVVNAIVRALAKNVDTYTTSGTSIYAGATAKALLLAAEQGKNPRSFGGVDLVTRLEGRVATAAPITGRIQDAFDPADPYGGDYANVIGQAFAAGGLSLAKSPKARSVVRFLIEQQCSKGYFRLGFTFDKTAADQSCDGAPRAERTADTDATAFALLALTEVKQTAATKGAAKRAVAWLEGKQRADGSFGGGTATEASNANSTGLAGWALAAWGVLKPATRAGIWVRGLQVQSANPCAGKLNGETGAIAYDAEAYAKGQTSGIGKKDSDQWRRASAQALPVLRVVPRATGVFTATAPRTAALGDFFRVRLTGVAPGQAVCLVEGGAATALPSGRHGRTSIKLVVRQRTGLHHYQVWLGSTRRDVTVRITG